MTPLEQIRLLQQYAQPFDPQQALSGNPNDPSMSNPNAGMTRNIAWGNVPGMEQFYSYDGANNAEQFDLAGAMPEFQQRGYQWMSARDPGSETFGDWIIGPDGQPIEQSARFGSSNEDRFKLAALAAAGVTGANIGLANGMFGGAEAVGGNALSGGGSGGIGTLGTIPAGSGASAAIPGLASQGLGPVAGGLGAAGAAGAAGSGGMNLSSMLPQLLQSGVGLAGQYMQAKEMGEGNDASLALMRQMYEQNRSDNQPLLDLRNAQIPRINALMADPSSIAETPDYKFQYGEGLNALNNRAAASGNLYSGNQMKAAQRYGQDFAGTKLDQSLNRLVGAANLGQVGATQNQVGASNFGTQGGNALQQGGAIRGSGYMGAANTIGQGMTDYANNQTQNTWMDWMMRGGR